MDRLTSMMVFAKAAELGSFSSAARAVGLSAPMVGKHVRFLEARLGGPLLRRTTRRHSLTDLGKVYYERCKRVLAEAEAADAAAAEQLGEAYGRLRVTAPVLFGRKCVAPILVSLADRHPRLELEMSFTDRPIDVLAGDYDLAIRNGTPPDSPEIIARRLFRQDMVVCGAPAYLARRGVPRTLRALGEHDAILYSRSGYARGWTFAGPDGRSQEIIPRSRVRLDDLEAIAEAAQGGYGLACLPGWLVRDRLEEGTLESVLADHPGFVIECHALWLRTPHLPPRVRVAVDALAEALPARTRPGDGLPAALGALQAALPEQPIVREPAGNVDDRDGDPADRTRATAATEAIGRARQRASRRGRP
jgi:DNA-binding transcriptional LysR family regulator